MMMMIARLKEGVQVKGDNEVGNLRKGVENGTPTSGADAPISLLRSRVWDASSRREHGR